MSPEQALGMPLDHRTDIYSFGIILYEMSTGQVPFSAPSFLAILDKQRNEPPMPPRELRPDLNIDPAFEAIVLRMLAKERDQRFPSMSEVEKAIGGLFTAVSLNQMGQMAQMGQMGQAGQPGYAGPMGVPFGMPLDQSLQPGYPIGGATIQRGEPTPVSGRLTPVGTLPPRQGLPVSIIVTIAALAALLVVLVTYVFLFRNEGPGEEQTQQNPGQAVVTERVKETAPQVNMAERIEAGVKQLYMGIDAGTRFSDDVSRSMVEQTQPDEKEKWIQQIRLASQTLTDIQSQIRIGVPIESSPSGAAVFIWKNDQWENLCETTPCAMEFPGANEPVKLRFTKKGFQSQVITIPPDKSTPVKVRLIKEFKPI
jgi:hypothetical protein